MSNLTEKGDVVMKAVKKLHLLVVLGVLMVSVGVFPPFVDAQTIYALLLIDDGNPSNFQQHKTSHTRMLNLLNRITNTLGIEVEEPKILQTSGRNRTSADFPTLENIKKWIDTVNVDRNDVVFVYASSHGGAHRQTRELYLNFSGVKVERPPIAEALAALPCRLKLLVTDACSYGVEITEPYFNPTLPEAYNDLFLKHRGFLNLGKLRLKVNTPVVMIKAGGLQWLLLRYWNLLTITIQIGMISCLGRKFLWQLSRGQKRYLMSASTDLSDNWKQIIKDCKTGKSASEIFR